MSYHVVWLWKYSMCIWKECVFSFFGINAVYISVKSIWSRILFNSAISLLIFHLEDLSFVDSGVLKSSSISVLPSISFLKSSKIFLIYLSAPLLGAYMFIMSMCPWWILPLIIMKCSSVSLFYGLCVELYFVWYKYCYLGFFPSVCL